MAEADELLPRENASDIHRTVNFSRVAGARTIDTQIRQLGSAIHVYGHQHRNRHCRVDRVLYVSHCLGYMDELASDEIRRLDGRPRMIWDSLDSSAAARSTEDEY